MKWEKEYLKSMEAFKLKDYSKALKYLQSSSKTYGKAQGHLAFFYYTGIEGFLNRDFNLAKEYALKGLENGDRDSSFILSQIYTLIENDKKLSLKYVKIAAENGYPIAQYNYANLLIKERKEMITALEYLKMADYQSFLPATAMLGIIYEKGLFDILEMKSMAKSYYEKVLSIGRVERDGDELLIESCKQGLSRIIEEKVEEGKQQRW